MTLLKFNHTCTVILILGMDNENIKIEIAQVGGIFNLAQSIKIVERLLIFTTQGQETLSRILDNEQLEHISQIATQALNEFGRVVLRNVQIPDSMATHITVDDGTTRKHVQFESGDEIPPTIAKLLEVTVGLLPEDIDDPEY